MIATDMQVERVTRETEGNSLTALVTSPDGELQVMMMMVVVVGIDKNKDHHHRFNHHHYNHHYHQVRAVMGPNCQSKIHLELLGKGLATMKMFTTSIIININIHIIIMTLIIPLYIQPCSGRR